MYAPVSSFAFQRSGDHLVGYAAPVNGHSPCLLELIVDDTSIAFARATRFSSAARAKSIRLGWCGVKIPGLAMASAIGNHFQVRCGVSGRPLWRYKTRVPIEGPPVQGYPLTVFDIITLSRTEDCSPGLAEIRPIMWQHLRKMGAKSFINSTYETFLGRHAEQGALTVLSDKSSEGMMDYFIGDILGSAEFKSKNIAGVIPGPFSFSFKYDLDILDEK